MTRILHEQHLLVEHAGSLLACCCLGVNAYIFDLLGRGYTLHRPQGGGHGLCMKSAMVKGMCWCQQQPNLGTIQTSCVYCLCVTPLCNERLICAYAHCALGRAGVCCLAAGCRQESFDGESASNMSTNLAQTSPPTRQAF